MRVWYLKESEQRLNFSPTQCYGARIDLGGGFPQLRLCVLPKLLLEVASALAITVVSRYPPAVL